MVAVALTRAESDLKTKTGCGGRKKILGLHERFPQDWVRRCSGEDRLAGDGVAVELPSGGRALHLQPAGNVGRRELHHQPGPTESQAGVVQVHSLTGEMSHLPRQIFKWSFERICLLPKS